MSERGAYVERGAIVFGITLTNRSFRNELRRSLRDCRFRPSFGLCLFEEGYSLNLFGFFVPLLFLDRWAREPHEIMESWGVSYADKSLHLNWGSRYKIFWMPWLREGVQHDVLREDGTWAKRTYSWDGEPDRRHVTSHPYRYVLRDGTVQDRTATVHVERSRYVWRCVRKMPLFWPLFAWKYYLEVQFSDEVGERSGSWKGGCVGCGYEMKPGETALDTLRRMERERVFR